MSHYHAGGNVDSHKVVLLRYSKPIQLLMELIFETTAKKLTINSFTHTYIIIIIITITMYILVS